MTYTDFTSTAFVYKAALLEALKDLPAFDGVQVTYGWPGRNTEREFLFLGEITWSDEHWTSVSARQREENYEIRTICNVQKPGGSDQEASERAGELIGALEVYLRGHPLPVTGARSVTVGIVPKSVKAGPYDAGAEAQFEVGIAVSARI